MAGSRVSLSCFLLLSRSSAVTVEVNEGCLREEQRLFIPSCCGWGAATTTATTGLSGDSGSRGVGALAGGEGARRPAGGCGGWASWTADKTRAPLRWLGHVRFFPVGPQSEARTKTMDAVGY